MLKRAAEFGHEITLERGILAIDSIRRRVCGKRACAAARPSGQICARRGAGAAARGAKRISRRAQGARRGWIYLTWATHARKKEFSIDTKRLPVAQAGRFCGSTATAMWCPWTIPDALELRSCHHAAAMACHLKLFQQHAAHAV